MTSSTTSYKSTSTRWMHEHNSFRFSEHAGLRSNLLQNLSLNIQRKAFISLRTWTKAFTISWGDDLCYSLYPGYFIRWVQKRRRWHCEGDVVETSTACSHISSRTKSSSVCTRPCSWPWACLVLSRTSCPLVACTSISTCRDWTCRRVATPAEARMCSSWG